MKTFVLMTALPPTTGHLQLIQFASSLTKEAEVVLNTQPDEPFPTERAKALRAAIRRSRLSHVKLVHFTKTIPQDPTTPGFWDMWRHMLHDFGLRPGDYIVASEPYGQKLAELTNTKFFPYDIDRTINPVKATPIRSDPIAHFNEILPEFQPCLRTTVTIFGAESTGKTTLSRRLAAELNGHWLFEYARPYLEKTVNEITVDSMTAIWQGQTALQKHARRNLTGKPYIIQDTDLFSTVGYWQFPHWQTTIGSCPAGLVKDAQNLRSDLYIITPSNIPFEQDPLRYGGDQREGSDDYWIKVCRANHLPYIVLKSSDLDGRVKEAKRLIEQLAAQKAATLSYDRHGF